MIDEIQKFIKKNSHCVLATSFQDKPYCSLMAYVSDEDCKKIYLASYKNTRKVKNLSKNKNLSLLIDSRSSSEPKALTIEGEFKKIDDLKRDTIIKIFLKSHPDMKEFLTDENTQLISVRIRSLMFIKGLDNPYYLSC